MGSLSLLQGIFLTQGIKPRSPELQADALLSEPPGKHQKSQMEFSRPQYWSGCPFPSPGDLPNPGIELRSPALQADSLPTKPQGKPLIYTNVCVFVCLYRQGGFPDSSVGKESACNARDQGSIPGLGRSPGEGKGYRFQCSVLYSSWGCKE